MVKCKRQKIVLLCLCNIILIIVLSLRVLIYRLNLHIKMKSHFFAENSGPYKLTCYNVLDNMIIGKWVSNNVSQDKKKEVKNFHRKVRDFYRIPQSLQRADNRCGNVHFKGDTVYKKDRTWFRALCDPDGKLPCCYGNRCVSRSVAQCSCKKCFDVRQQIHAELSTWVPADPSCKITTFVGEQDACKVLRGVTILFIGDSFMRQLYISVLSLVSSNNPYGPLKEKTSPEKRKLCDRYYRLSTECTPLILNAATKCDKTTQLRRVSFWQAKDTSRIMELIKKLQGQPNSFVIVGAGIHEEYNVSVVENKILDPFLHQLVRSPWPMPIWLSTHSPGLLKAPRYSKQQIGNVVNYNIKINDILRKREIPILDFFQMTKNVMSYDGTHYGPGVNDVKAQILLNYIQEVRANLEMTKPTEPCESWQ